MDLFLIQQPSFTHYQEMVQSSSGTSKTSPLLQSMFWNRIIKNRFQITHELCYSNEYTIGNEVPLLDCIFLEDEFKFFVSDHSGKFHMYIPILLVEENEIDLDWKMISLILMFPLSNIMHVIMIQ